MRRSVLSVLLEILVFIASAHANCDHPIFCQGPILAAIQEANFFNDSKCFVDMPLKQPVSVVVEAFSRLPNKSEATLFNFLQEYFLPAGSDLAQVTPEDWKPFPAFLANISQPELRTWATFVHQRWQYLARVFVQNASCVGCYSSLPVARPFIIAGGRFREYYYWDSYWIIEGLLVSGMLNTTRNILLNMLDLVDQIGFMPNGGRIYYLDRSQPPLLTQMVAKYFEASHDMPLLVRALPTLDREYTWFMRQRAVTLPGGLVLNHYAANTTTPRPESWLNDVTTAQAVPESQRPQLFAEIATGAETGWDFSSRWFADGMNLSTIQARAILPVDLNSIMYMNERRLAAFHMLLNDTAQANYYTQQAERRLVAIQKYFWNPERLSWFDYNYLTGRQNTAWFPSNLMPLWARAYDPRQFPLKQVEAIVLAQRKAFSFPAGVPTSYTNTTQQWDYPNAWPPLQFFLIEALLEQPSAVLQQIATDLMQRWITTNFCAWNATGYMFEKYDALHIGLHGQGGEYDVQNGFGWTNGVVLGYLHRFGSTLRVTEHCPPVPTLVSAPRVQTATVSCLDFPEIRHHLAR